jgi:xylan 1,4-beta-xylosidase
MMKHSLELEAEVGVNLGGLLTWAFTFPGTPYFAGYRVLATNGIHMPVLGAFDLLGRLAGTRLPLTSTGARPLDDILANGVRADADVDGIATLNGAAVQVLVWNYHDDLVAVTATPVHLAVTVPASFGSRVRVSHLRVDESHGDAYAVWVAQGMPASPSPTQLAALQQAMDPAPLAPDRMIAVAADGSAAVDFDLPRFGVSLLTIAPAGAGDGGVDAGEGDGSADAAGGHDAALGPPNKSSGCGCQTAGRGEGALARFALAALLLITRRRNRPAADRRPLL